MILKVAGYLSYYEDLAMVNVCYTLHDTRQGTSCRVGCHFWVVMSLYGPEERSVFEEAVDK